MIKKDELKDFKLVEKNLTVSEMTEKFAEEMIGTFHQISKLGARQLGRVLKAFIRIPVLEFDAKTLQSADEHKLLIALIKMQDTKSMMMDAMMEELEAKEKEALDVKNVDSK